MKHLHLAYFITAYSVRPFVEKELRKLKWDKATGIDDLPPETQERRDAFGLRLNIWRQPTAGSNVSSLPKNSCRVIHRGRCRHLFTSWSRSSRHPSRRNPLTRNGARSRTRTDDRLITNQCRIVRMNSSTGVFARADRAESALCVNLSGSIWQ